MPEESINDKMPVPTPTGVKYDEGKPPMAYIPPFALLEVGKVLGYGVGKYNPWNWAKGLAFSRILSATMRHILAFLCGQDRDEESGLPHLAHAATNLLFILEWCHSPTERHKLLSLDDRYYKSDVEQRQ